MFYKKGGKMRLCTLRETPIYTKMVNAFFNEDEKGDLHAYVAKHAEEGDVLPHSEGCRKLRYARPGMGKRGGVRVIYYRQVAKEIIHLLIIYAKAKQEHIPAHLLKAIVKELNND